MFFYGYFKTTVDWCIDVISTILSCWRSSNHEGRVVIPLTDLTPLYFCACTQPGPGFPMS